MTTSTTRDPKYTAVSNMLLLQHLEKIRRAFVKADIPLMYTKGSAFLDTLYPNVAERWMCDVDVLVQEQDLDRIDKLLHEIGFTRGFMQERPATSEHFYERVYTDNATGKAHIEIHRAFCQKERFDIDYDGLWSRIQHYDTPQRPVPTLSPEDSLLYVSLHEGLHSFIIDKRSVEDMRRIISIWKPDWAVVVKRAKQWKMRATLYVSLTVAARHGAEVPAWVLRALKPALPRRMLMHALIDLKGKERSRFKYWSRTPQLLTQLYTIEDPVNFARFLGAYAQIRFDDWRGAHKAR